MAYSNPPSVLALLIVLLQIRGMHTLIRDAVTTKHDFVFYADRLIRLVQYLYLICNQFMIWIFLLFYVFNRGFSN